MRIRRFVIATICFFCVFPSQAWNALGHRLVGQIAYNHLNTAVKTRVDFYNHALDSVYQPQTFVNAAPWMDTLRYVNDVWLQPLHYIDTPFSWDGTALVQPEPVNALSAIADAKGILKDPKSTDFNKGFAVRVLLHVIGDLHQPLHAADQYSQKHPDGDRGGNLFPLGNNSVGGNLHAYWDRGAGFLITSKEVSDAELSRMASTIEEKWSCDLESTANDPKAWSEESFQVAVDQAYSIKPSQRPDQNYQDLVQKTTEQRLALAGCRLAKAFNDVLVD